MEIKKIDKNFALQEDLIDGEIINVPSDCVNLYGLYFDNDRGFIRMNKEDADKVSPNVSYLSEHTAGGRLAFMTDSSRIKINVTYNALEKMYHMPLTGQAGFALLEDINGKQYHRYTFGPCFDDASGFTLTSKVFINKGMRKYVLYFPLYNKVKSLQLVIEKGSKIAPFNPYKNVLPFLYYGSSITQGGCASRSDNAYQSIVSKLNKIDHINLGFSGNCKGEIEMAKYCGKTKCSIFICAYDHNAPSLQHLKDTHENFFKEFRTYQPNTPVIFITATNYFENPKVYSLRRNVVYNTFLNALKRGDKNVYFIDGKSIYPSKIRESCSVDGAHPNDLGFYYIAKSIIKLTNKILNKEH